MRKTLAISAVISAALTLGAAAFAAISSAPSSPSLPPDTSQATSTDWTARTVGPRYPASGFDNTTVSHAAVTLQQAIADAATSGGGPALDGFLEQHDGKPMYRIRVLRNGNQIATERVDAATGQVTPIGKTIPRDDWTAMERQEVANLDHAKLPLAQAIAVAQKTQAGKAVNAGVSDYRAELAYNIDLVAKGYVDRLRVQPSQPMTAARSDHPAV